MSISSRAECSKKRAPNFSISEKTLLVTIIHNFKHIIENKQTNATTWREKDSAWTKIMEHFNSQTKEGHFRTKDALKKYYENIKKNIRKEVAEEKKEIFKTGGGTFDIKNDPLKELTLNLLNKKTVFGLNNHFDGDSALSSAPVIVEGSSSIVNEKENNDIRRVSLEHNYTEEQEVDNDESGTAASGTAANVSGISASQESSKVFSGHVSEAKTPSLKHTWSKRRRPTPQQPSTELNMEYIETSRIKRKCYESELDNILARKEQEETIFKLQKEKLLIEIEIKKQELENILNKP